MGSLFVQIINNRLLYLGKLPGMHAPWQPRIPSFRVLIEVFFSLFQTKIPLLSEENSKLEIQTINYANTLRGDFVSKLPIKVKKGLHPDTPLHLDISKTTGLAQGEKKYYEQQFAMLRSFEEVDAILTSNINNEGTDTEGQAQHERGINISNWANVFLLLFKIYATVQSGSLAIGASTLDSVLDLLAGGILWLTNYSMKSINIYKYPIGKLRGQPVGIIVFAAIMATLGFQVLVVGVRQLIVGEASEKMSTNQLFWMCIIMLTATGVKLLLWIYCRSSQNQIVRAYAKDHFFDVITNLVGLVAAVIGDRFHWWIDPVGAIALAIYTIKIWSETVMENAVSLMGLTAPPEMLQKLTYLALRHSALTKHIDTVRAYTLGALYFAEIDIELPEDMPLKEAHDIGESLQVKIENLGEVERAFVHLDYECNHKPEHTIMSRLPR